MKMKLTLSGRKEIVVFAVIFFILSISRVFCQVKCNDPVRLYEKGWIIEVNPSQEIINISHDNLESVIGEATLYVKRNNTLVPLSNWKASVTGGDKLEIETYEPFSFWRFEPGDNSILISSTSSDLILIGKVPSSPERVVAKLVDKSGVPVTWKGTDEIVASWKGSETIHDSYLPFNNPEVMTFGLGQISSDNLHSLFDRKNDVAIDFPESAMLRRNTTDMDMLDLILPVNGNAIVKLIPDYYTKALGVPFYSRIDNSVFKTAPLIWGSWTAYYYEVKESDIVRNADWIASNLKPYGFRYVQLDDGYDRGKPEGHYWIENWNKNLFPHGPEWLAKYIKAKGLKPGLWLVPNSYAGFADKHPDWYLYDKSGKLIEDYKTPALDYTNPNVQEWLRKLFTTLKKWGFEYFKFDGECSLPEYVPALDRNRLYDKNDDFIGSYRKRLKMIRDIIGPETFIEGCVAGTPLNGIGYFNSCFNGEDMYNSWKGSYAVFSSVNANAFLNNMVIYVMPGEGIDVSPLMSVEEAKKKMPPRTIEVALTREDPFTGFGTTLAEARTLVSFISLTGVAYPLTSIMPDLPEERVRLLKMTMPTMPILPVDLYSRGTDITWNKFKHTTPERYIHNYPEIIDLKINSPSGFYDVAALINWRTDTVTRNISLSDKLGLRKGIKYLVFDFWNQKLLGVFNDSVEVTVAGHDTRVLNIHELLNRPQLAGISRHISGTYSVLDQKWDDVKMVLKGESETISGEDYSIFIYVPDGFNFKGSEAISSGGQRLVVIPEQTSNILKLSFKGQTEVVSWMVAFQRILLKDN
jgi:hypothetical protein